MKILVPVDGSTASKNAAAKAVEIARKEHASIKLVTVVNVSGVYFTESLNDFNGMAQMQRIDMMQEAIRKNAEDVIDAFYNELNDGSVPMEKEVLTGESYIKILEAAKDGNFDLIIMGNRGFSKIKRFFVGSVTQKVISEATCPVLVIHTDKED